MTQIPTSLLDAALQLPEEARIELAERLFESLGVPPGVPCEDDPGWPDELRRRLDDIESGREKPIPWEEARKIMFRETDDDDESAPG